MNMQPRLEAFPILVDGVVVLQVCMRPYVITLEVPGINIHRSFDYLMYTCQNFFSGVTHRLYLFIGEREDDGVELRIVPMQLAGVRVY